MQKVTKKSIKDILFDIKEERITPNESYSIIENFIEVETNKRTDIECRKYMCDVFKTIQVEDIIKNISFHKDYPEIKNKYKTIVANTLIVAQKILEEIAKE